MKTIRSILLLAPIALLTACGNEAAPPRPSGSNGDGNQTASATVSHDEAKTMFQSLCYTCHGMTGKGDGPGAAACEPKPRSFSDQAWLASVTDEQISKTVLYGGAAVGKSAMMPAQPQLKSNPEMLKALVKIVRSFGAKQ